MFKVQKTMEISGSHQLSLDYDSACKNLHGHNWFVTVYIRANNVNKAGMIMDFVEIKKRVHDRFDHKHINDVVDFNPTAENMARYIAACINEDRTVDDIHRQMECYRVDIEETSNNIATWEVDDAN